MKFGHLFSSMTSDGFLAGIAFASEFIHCVRGWPSGTVSSCVPGISRVLVLTVHGRTSESGSLQSADYLHLHRRSEHTPKRLCDGLGSFLAQSACSVSKTAPVAVAINRLVHLKDSWLSGLALSGCRSLFCHFLLTDSYACKLYAAPARSWAEV